jgi:uncharacterized delta-60 repeat protein
VGRRWTAALAAALVVCGLATGASAAPTTAGDPDPAFLDGGVALIGPGAEVRDLVVDGSGRIVACGRLGHDAFVSRFTEEGEPDPTFGDDGLVVLPQGPATDATACAARADGRVYVAVGVGAHGSLVRLRDDGERDLTFGAGFGSVALDRRPRDVILDGTGALVPSTRSTFIADPGMVAVERFTDTGTPDPDYGVAGTAWIPDGRPTTFSLHGIDAARQPDGSLSLVIHATDEGWVARLDPSGRIIEPAPGVPVVPLGVSPYDAAFDTAGRILVLTHTGQRAVVVRYTADGTRDLAYVAAPLAMRGYAVAVAPDGSTYVGGHVPFDGYWANDAVLARLTPAGALDTTFGDGGYVVEDLDVVEAVLAITFDGTGRLVVGGWARGESAGDLPWGFVTRYLATPLPAPPPPPGPTPPGPTPPGPTPPGPTPSAPPRGYWMLSEIGDVYAFGSVPHLMDWRVPAPIVDIEPSPSGNGYWLLNANGVVVQSGDAADLRVLQFPNLGAGERAAALSATPSGTGLWIFTTWGRVITVGDAPHLGDMAGTPLNGPVLDGAVSPTGQGYWMVGSDGGIFSFGDARFFGSMGGEPLNAPVQSLVPTATGHGYWLVASDGGIFAFGDAAFRGSMGAVPLNRPVTGMVRFGDGYLMVGEDGGIFNFSSEPFLGSLGADPPDSPIVAVAGHV